MDDLTRVLLSRQITNQGKVSAKDSRTGYGKVLGSVPKVTKSNIPPYKKFK